MNINDVRKVMNIKERMDALADERDALYERYQQLQMEINDLKGQLKGMGVETSIPSQPTIVTSIKGATK